MGRYDRKIKKENLKEDEVLKRGYKYLNDKYTFEIYNFMKEFVSKHDIINKIKEHNFNFEDFIEYNFIYEDIFESFLTNGIYKPGNIYYDIDIKFKYNIKSDTFSLRNTIFALIKKIHKELKISKIIEDKLYEVIIKKPKKYKSRFEIYGEYFSKTLIKRCEFILNSEKYNL